MNNMDTVYVLTRKECIPADNQTEVTIVGVYQIKSAAVIQQLAECETIVKELRENFDKEDIVVTKLQDLTLIDVCVDTKNYYLEINEFEIGEVKNTFV